MLEGFTTYPSPLPIPRGAPENPPSTHLRTLAWLRFLLDRLDDVQAWATGSKPNHPEAWNTNRKSDANLLRKLFRLKGKAPKISARTLLRPASLLDTIFGPLLDGQGGGGKWFSDKLSRGIARPSDQHLAWIDDLVPGSLKAFYEPPEPFDPWFYDALDFQSPWFGRIFLWRAMDPDHFDPNWKELLATTPEAGRSPKVNARVRSKRDVRWSLTDSERDRFAGEIELAVVHTGFPDEANEPGGLQRAVEQMHAARAARRSGKAVAHPVTKRLHTLSDAQAFIALTNAIATYRLANIVDLDDRGLAAWCLRGTLDAMRGRIVKVQRRVFYPLPRNVAPLEGSLRKLGLWEPRAAKLRRVESVKRKR